MKLTLALGGVLLSGCWTLVDFDRGAGDAGGGVDSGTPVDAGEPDAAPIADAGPDVDGGSSDDAGALADAGSPEDAGSLDTGTDAGTGPDSGPDAGSFPPYQVLAIGGSVLRDVSVEAPPSTTNNLYRGALAFHPSGYAYIAAWSGSVYRYTVGSDGALSGLSRVLTPPAPSGSISNEINLTSATVDGDSLYLTRFYRWEGPALERHSIGSGGGLTRDTSFDPYPETNSRTVLAYGARSLVVHPSEGVFLAIGYETASGSVVPEGAVYHLGTATTAGSTTDILNLPEQAAYASFPRIILDGDELFWTYGIPDDAAPRALEVGHYSVGTASVISRTTHSSVHAGGTGFAQCGDLIAVTGAEMVVLYGRDLIELAQIPYLDAAASVLAFNPGCQSLAVHGLATGGGAVQVFDVTAPASPVLVQTLDYDDLGAGLSQGYTDGVTHGSTLYFTASAGAGQAGAMWMHWVDG